MTADNSSATLARQRRERRSIPPFGDGSSPNQLSNLLDRVLAKSRFSPFPDKILTADRNYFVDSREAGRHIVPRFEVSVDCLPELTERIGLEPQDLQVGLSARSRHLRQYEVLDQWPIDTLPTGTFSPPPVRLRDLQSGRGMDFILAVRVTASGEHGRHAGLTPGKVICRKEFSVREAVETLTFPFSWVEFGGNTGYPSELLWTIEWTESDEDENRYRKPVDQVLTVLVNSNAEKPLTDMAAVPGTNDLAWRMLAAEITTQIWADVLSNTDEEPTENDTNTLLGQVFARLNDVSGKPYSEIRLLASHDDSLTELRSLIAKMFMVVA